MWGVPHSRTAAVCIYWCRTPADVSGTVGRQKHFTLLFQTSYLGQSFSYPLNSKYGFGLCPTSRPRQENQGRSFKMPKSKDLILMKNRLWVNIPQSESAWRMCTILCLRLNLENKVWEGWKFPKLKVCLYLKWNMTIGPDKSICCCCWKGWESLSRPASC